MRTEGTSRSLVMAALMLGGFTLGVSEFASMALLPEFARAFAIGAPEASRAISAYAMGVVVGAPVLAVVAARVSRGKLLIGLMLFYAVANGLSAAATSYWSFVLSRFVSGLPHGAYFGVASLVAASVARPGQRSRTIALLFIGLTVATIVGVPLATTLGQHFGWRIPYGVMAGLALLTALGVLVTRPQDDGAGQRSPLAELGALRRPQVWLTLGVGAIGFGGMFAVYTYVGPVLANVTRVGPDWEPVALALFGVGLTVGNLLSGVGADRALIPTTVVLLAGGGVMDAIYAMSAGSLPGILAATFLVGMSGGLGSVIQARLMDVAGDAQTLAASLMHSALNIANALGPAVAAWTIADGLGWRSTGWVGLGLAVCGLVVLGVSVAVEKGQGAALDPLGS